MTNDVANHRTNPAGKIDFVPFSPVSVALCIALVHCLYLRCMQDRQQTEYEQVAIEYTSKHPEALNTQPAKATILEIPPRE